RHGPSSGQTVPSVARTPDRTRAELPHLTAALCAGARILRLLSVTGFPSASVLGWQSSRLPTDHMAWPRSCHTRGARPCPRQLRTFTHSAAMHEHTAWSTAVL